MNPRTDEWYEHERRDRKAHPLWYRWIDRIETAGGIVAILIILLFAIGFLWNAYLRVWGEQ